MERDIQRDRSQWRGCHTFNNIICDGDQVKNQKRNGGLKMGHTYYYYYELDGSTETYDPSMPTTNACPYLPGQTVNTVEVPQEHSLSRTRSASMNSLRTTDFKTMDPKNRFMTPRPAPPVPSLPDLRLGSSPAMSLVHKRSARSLSPAPSWKGAARRFFARKKGNHLDGDAGSETEVDSHYDGEVRHLEEPRSATPSGSVRSHDISLETLERFLSDDLPPAAPTTEPSRLYIPDEILEENEDDDNFATSAVSETAPFTMLSPPPFQRSFSSSSARDYNNGSTTTIIPPRTQQDNNATETVGVSSTLPKLKLDDVPRSHFSFSTTSSSFVSTSSPQSIESRDLNQFSFFDDSDDEKDDIFPPQNEPFAAQGIRRSSNAGRGIRKHNDSPITEYSLPQSTSHEGEPLNTSRISTTALGTGLVTRLDSGVVLSNTDLLSHQSIDTGLDDLVSDMGWMADVIQPKFI
ncbi:uncharacterized protein F4812DRAFT_46082 [Daldinia caldariorum]|uniref:uncharacterized protein n=1 Tax=Daldinia caldariorum TaxID=326644 RepID=UPI002007FC38|nr:uncharacterized protein F4812DRAFT_46082 [Daldinia caldariorum]KAI1467024.1 hypothetical protein F4812DRAFT_46082 [Daldinia caldariorum]